MPLVNGLVDLSNENDINTFDQQRECEIEGSKIFSKEIMKRFNIPTAKYKKYDNENDAKTDIL